MKKLLFICICFALLLFPTIGLTTNRYVTCAGGATSTDHDGTSGSEYVSQADVMANLADFSDGDDLYFLNASTCPGSQVEFTGTLVPTWEGVDTDNWSIIGCYTTIGDHTCVTQPRVASFDNDAGGGYSDNNLIDLTNKAFIQIQDLDIYNSSTNWQHIKGVVGAAGASSTGIEIDNGTDQLNNPVRVWRCTLSRWSSKAIVSTYIGPYSSFIGNTINDSGNGIYLTGEGAQSHSYALIARNTCNTLYGYWNATQDLQNDGHCAATTNSDYSIIEDNVSNDAWTSAFLIIATNAGTGTTKYIRHNVMRNNTSNGMSCWQALVIACQTDAKTGNPNCYGNLGYGNTLIDDSSLIDNPPCATHTEPRPTMLMIEMEPTTQENAMFNNTAYKAWEDGAEIRDDSNNTVFLNNIIWTETVDDHMFQFQGTPGGTHVIDHNLYWSSAGDPSASSIWRDETTSRNFAAWQSTSGFDVSGGVDNPDFVTPGSDFTLTSISPAIDNGGFISNVTAEGSGTTITVANPYRFHGNFGLRDEDGDLIDGMLVSFYHGTLRQDVEILSVNYGTATLTLDQTITTIYNSGSATDPDTTTQIALRFIGTAPDIGANEYGGDTTDLGYGGVVFNGAKLN